MRKLIGCIILVLIAAVLMTGILPIKDAKAVTYVETLTDAEIIAKVLWAECRGVDSVTEQAAVAWCILNRVDHEDYPDTVREVATQPHQFAWNKYAPVTPELLDLAQDVLLRWEIEKIGAGDAGRVLPEEYIFFAGRNGRNWFRTEYRGGHYWWWTLESPYETEDVKK